MEIRTDLLCWVSLNKHIPVLIFHVNPPKSTIEWLIFKATIEWLILPKVLHKQPDMDSRCFLGLLSTSRVYRPFCGQSQVLRDVFHIHMYAGLLYY